MRADLPDRLDGLADALERRRYPDNAELVREAALALRALRDARIGVIECEIVGDCGSCASVGAWESWHDLEGQRVKLVVVGEEG